jgi:argonaute-like protein implicated in RNA metabolism and viral defense
VQLAITLQHGEGDLVQIAQDILGLTKLNYNACLLGEGQPITVKYSDRVGEILLANPGLPAEQWKQNFWYCA